MYRAILYILRVRSTSLAVALAKEGLLAYRHCGGTKKRIIDQSHAVLSPHTKILAHLAGLIHFLSIPFLPFGLFHNSGLVIPLHCAHFLQAAILLSHGCTTLPFYLITFSHCWSMAVVIHRGPFHCYSFFVRRDINICALFDFVGYDDKQSSIPTFRTIHKLVILRRTGMWVW